MILEISDNRKLCGGVYRLEFDHGGKLPKAAPGQFVHLRCSDSFDPLLRRPFSVFEMDESRLSLLYAVVGKGTGALSGRRPGEAVDLIGPLGRGFSITPPPARAAVVAGGMGIASTFMLAEALSGRIERFITGARTCELLVCSAKLRELGVEPEEATDDGSRGEKSSAALVLERCLEETRVSAVYACGPEAMLREVVRITGRRRVFCEVSLESRMACGVGACLGCAVKTASGGRARYSRVCKEGPVFNAENILWE